MHVRQQAQILAGIECDPLLREHFGSRFTHEVRMRRQESIDDVGISSGRMLQVA